MRQRAVAVWSYFGAKILASVQELQEQVRGLGSAERDCRGWRGVPGHSNCGRCRRRPAVSASIIKYVGKSQYTFNAPQDTVAKDVHWYLMMSDSYYSKPQREEYFVDSGYYKFHEAYHLLKFSNEKQILERAYNEYLDLKKRNLWGSRKYF